MEKEPVFISFASQERKLAEAIQKLVEEAFKFKTFLSDTTITAGEIWQDEIVTALNNAELLLVLCSPFSITRQWVNFECGAAYLPKKNILFLCHSGLTTDLLYEKKETHPWLDFTNALDIYNTEQDNGFVENLINRIKDFLNIERSIEPERYDAFRVMHKKNIDEAIKEVVGRLSKEDITQKKFLKFKLTRNDNFIHMEPTCVEKMTKQMEDREWLYQVNKMNLFLHKEEDFIPNVGVAIGIQNCLFDGNDIYVGVRMKAIGDANATSVGVAMGSYNTGYQLMKSKEDKLRLESESTLQDLFVSKKEIKRSMYRIEAEKLKKMEQRLTAFGSNLWRINFNEKKEPKDRTSNEEASVATIFINNSRWFPRFEIGVWKFIDISNKEAYKNNFKNNILVAGFGEDIFLDYRGQEDKEGINFSHWIWAKNGEVHFWSYPEERLIPRLKPTKYTEPKTAVLVDAKIMSEIYGDKRKYTPFTSTKDLMDDNVIEGQFSLPARELLSCF